MIRPGIVTSRLDGRGITDMAALARRAVARYGMSPDCRLHLYPLTENWTFLIEPPSGDPAVLRIYRPGGRPAVEIHSELAWMSAIRSAEQGSLLPNVIQTLDGCELLEIVRDRPLERCFCVAFSWVSGREPAADELKPWFPQLGALTARLHRQARAWAPPPWFQRPRWDVSTTLGERGHWGPWHASVTDVEERRQLQRLADVVTTRLGRFGTGPARFGLVHADLRLANLLVDGERVTVIDFDDCGFSWFLYDLACALTFNEGRPDVDDLIAAWVQGYRRVEPLSGEDEDEIMTFLMLRRLMLSAYIGLRPDTELAAELLQARFSAQTCAIAEPYLRRGV